MHSAAKFRATWPVEFSNDMDLKAYESHTGTASDGFIIPAKLYTILELEQFDYTWLDEEGKCGKYVLFFVASNAFPVFLCLIFLK